ncbi:type II toxin-antitoxin system VapC family toxin [Glycomyces arizonensis]|uniref:type II toxin-antitoxin system VapC family toxin n=1 Tax=Glycomyces arizonensis TaxID=256035 RepID=UPI001B7FC10E|nr:PIN domain-containing protein [Glycomyces arizonensis]
MRGLVSHGPRVAAGARPVLTEVCWLLDRNRGSKAEAALLRALADSHGPLTLSPTTDGELLRIAELVERYADLPPGALDASVAALAERLGVREVATIDHRHFNIVRPVHVEAFTLLP